MADIINQLWQCFVDILKWNGWQGVGGVAQIVAAFLALATIRQATEERKGAVRPLFVSRGADPMMGKQWPAIHLENMGFGAALDSGATFHYRGSKKVEDCGITDPDRRDISPGTITTLHVPWEGDTPPVGTLVIEYRTSLGEKLRDEFQVEVTGKQVVVTPGKQRR